MMLFFLFSPNDEISKNGCDKPFYGAKKGCPFQTEVDLVSSLSHKLSLLCVVIVCHATLPSPDRPRGTQVTIELKTS